MTTLVFGLVLSTTFYTATYIHRTTSGTMKKVVRLESRDEESKQTQGEPAVTRVETLLVPCGPRKKVVVMTNPPWGILLSRPWWYIHTHTHTIHMGGDLAHAHAQTTHAFLPGLLLPCLVIPPGGHTTKARRRHRWGLAARSGTRRTSDGRHR